MNKTAGKAKATKKAAAGKTTAAPQRTLKQKPAKSKAAKPAVASREAAAGQVSGSTKREKWPAKDVEFFRRTMLQLRDQLTGQIMALKIDSLTREDAVNSEEDGTDAFERQFALNIVRSESHSVVEIDDALKRLDESTYGSCEECGGLIGRARLAALPFVRLCIGCKSKQEDGKPHFQPIAAETIEPQPREPRERE